MTGALPAPPARRWTATEARTLATRALREAGVPAASDVADVLVETSLAGVHTHGLRLLGPYLDELARGVAVAAAEPRVVQDSGAVVSMDAGGSLGVVAGLAATRVAVDRARRHGVGIVGVRNSNHFGAAGAFARRIARERLLGIATTSAAARVAAHGGAEPVLGTNPVAVAFGEEFSLDMATSQVCFGAVKERGRSQQRLEPGWAVRCDGTPAEEAAEAAALAPLGGYKGQGLAMVVTLLTAVLVGGPIDGDLSHFGESPDGRHRGITHLLVAVDPQTLGGWAGANARLGRLLDTVRDGVAAPGVPPLSPGDRRRANEARQDEHGLELDDMTAALLLRIDGGRRPA